MHTHARDIINDYRSVTSIVPDDENSSSSANVKGSSTFFVVLMAALVISFIFESNAFLNDEKLASFFARMYK
jgi:hypothetical protein